MSAQTEGGHSGLSIIAGQNVTPVLQIVTWLLQCISVLAILVKLGIKIKVIRDFTRDDIAILITLVSFATIIPLVVLMTLIPIHRFLVQRNASPHLYKTEMASDSEGMRLLILRWLRLSK